MQPFLEWDLVEEKWTSIVFDIQSKHWTGNSLYHQCSDPELSRADEIYQKWLSPKSQAFEWLQSIVFDKATLKRGQLKTKLLTTDHHCQIKKYMRGEEEDIYHQFDVWHFCKSVKIKLLNAAKKKACEDFKLWIKSICNHFWNEILLKEKWKSIVFLIQSKH